MKLIRLAVISMVILFVMAAAMGALLPSTVLVSRAINVNASKDSVIPHLKNIHQWESWVFGMKLPSVTVFSPSHADLGGTLVNITGISDSTVISSWKGRSGNVQTSTIRVIGDTVQKVTIVQWQFEQKLKWYPWEKFGSIMNDKILGPMMEKNLNNLKLLVEKQ